MRQDACLAGRGHIVRSPHTQGIHRVYEERIDVGIDWIDPRRQKETRRVCTLLMQVIKNFRMPLVNDLRGVLGLQLGKTDPVAVVVMAHVLRIEDWRRGALGWRAERLLVPVHNHLLAVGIL